MSKASPAGSFEEGVERLSAFIGDGAWLLEKESRAQFRAEFTKGETLTGLSLSDARSKETPDNLALANYLAEVSHGTAGDEGLRVGMAALFRSGILSKAPAALAQRAFGLALSAIVMGQGRSSGLASEVFRDPAWQGCAAQSEGGAEERFAKNLGNLAYRACVCDCDDWDGWAETLTKILDAAESWPGFAAGGGEAKSSAGKPGAALMELATPRGGLGNRWEKETDELLGARALGWIKERRDWPAQGEMAAALCESIKRSVERGGATTGELALRALKASLAEGMGARRVGGEQPLRILMGARAKTAKAEKILSEAGQALLDAGAHEMDVIDNLDEALERAPNQDLTARLRAKMERRALSDAIAPEGFGPLSREEVELVAAFRRQKEQAAPAEPASRAEPARKRPSL